MSTQIQITPPSDITVGTTAIQNGTDGRILFQEGGVVQQDSAFHWDNTNKRLGVGTNVPLSTVELYGNSTGVTTPLQIRNTLGGANAIAAIKFTNTSVTNSNAQNWAWIGSKRDTLISKSRLVFAASDNIANNPSTADIGMVLGFDKSLLIGTDGVAGARLDVRAQGALSTDIAFRVRNSANSFDNFRVNGDGSIYARVGGVTSAWTIQDSGGTQTILLGWQNANVSMNLGGLFTLYGSADNREILAGIGGKGTLGLGFNAFGGLGTKPNEPNTNTLYIKNGTAPNLNYTDSIQLYSADIVAGNAAPHFRTENGSVVKLYRQDLPTNPTTAEIATFLSNLGLANLV